MTEDCFQQTPLEYAGGVQWLQIDDNASSRTAIAAVRTTSGKGDPWHTAQQALISP